jgi:nucleotide-binding universal stress UspA family protein
MGLKQVLIPVTLHTTERQLQSALAEAIAIYRMEPTVRVHLLNVQVPVSRHVSDFFDSAELRQIHMDAGLEELAEARELLDAAAVPYKMHIEIGRTAETIVRVAQEFGCSKILMGHATQPGFPEKLFGTLVSQVRHLLQPASNCQVIGS